MSHANAIQLNNDVLQRCTTINLYVIDFLRAKDVLDEAQESDLKAERSLLKQRILLLQWLRAASFSKYESFLEVMKDVEQEHVANLLTGNTEESHLPLSDARYRRLVDIRHKMASVTRVDNEVIAELRSSKAISMTDAEEIRAETVEYAKVSKLLSAIMRRSNQSYSSFQGVLRNTLQTAAAGYLTEGEMPVVHVNNNRPDLDGPLSLAFNDLIKTKTTDDSETRTLLAELNGLNLNLVKAVPEHSIEIFVYCKTVQNAVNFTQLFRSGRLQHILARIFNRLLLTIEPHNSRKLDFLYTLEENDAITLEEFTGIEGWMTEGRHNKRQQESREISGIDAFEHTGLMVESSFSGQKPSSEIYGIDASTQTGYTPGRRQRKRKRKKPKKSDPGSSMLIDKDMGVELQKKPQKSDLSSTMLVDEDMGEKSQRKLVKSGPSSSMLVDKDMGEKLQQKLVKSDPRSSMFLDKDRSCRLEPPYNRPKFMDLRLRKQQEFEKDKTKIPAFGGKSHRELEESALISDKLRTQQAGSEKTTATNRKLEQQVNLLTKDLNYYKATNQELEQKIVLLTKDLELHKGTI